MDPKTLSSLDPKLRETYERVMNTAASSSNSPTPPTPNTSTSPMPTFDAMPATSTSLASDTTTPIINQPIQTAELSALQSTLTPPPLSLPATPMPSQPLLSPAQVNQLSAQSSNSTSPVIRILYIIAGIIFFAVYAIFWLKVFKFPLPF